MQNQTFQLEIATPCAEPLDQMAPHPQGFYCHTCKHKVIDFTEKLPSEIAQFFTKHAQDDICGRFYDHQLEEDYVFWERKSPQNTLKYAAGFLVSMLLLESVAAEPLPLKPSIEQNSMPLSGFKSNDSLPKSLTVKGQVIDMMGGKGIEKAQVSIINGNTVYGTGSTNADGFFEIKIIKEYHANTILSITPLDSTYAKSSILLSQFIQNKNTKIVLEPQKSIIVKPQRPITSGIRKGKVIFTKPIDNTPQK